MTRTTVDFDSLVREMRRVRTDAAIAALYEQLFRLDQWFVPGDPQDPGAPMQWRFPNGRNTTPCILLYTDDARARRHADEVAASFGKTGEVMALSVADAVRWILSGDLGVEWASVNFGAGSENFPLYFDQVATLASSAGVQTSTSGAFFPAEYKQFPFREGDLLANLRRDGKYAITKILKIDKIVVHAGDSITIQNQRVTAPVDDFLLIISAAYGASEFDSLEQARAAAASGAWTTQIAHVPNRAPGAMAGQVHVGSAPVTDEELVGYRTWREAFDNDEAGVF